MQSEDDIKKPGVTQTFQYAADLYRALHKKSKLVETVELIEHGYPVAPDDPQVRIFEGYSTKVADKLGLSSHQRNKALGLLRSMNCLTRIKTPGGSSPGIWIMNYEPTPEQYIEFKESNLRVLRRTLPSKADLIIDQLREIIREQRSVREVVSTIETQLVELSARVSELEKQRGHDVRESPPVSEV